MLQVMRGNDAEACMDDQGNCSVSVSESEDDEPIANVCRQKPTEDKKKPEFPGFKDRAQWCEEAEKHLQSQWPRAFEVESQVSSGPVHQSSNEEFPNDKTVDWEFPMKCIWPFQTTNSPTTHGGTITNSSFCETAATGSFQLQWYCDSVGGPATSSSAQRRSLGQHQGNQH